MQEKTVTDTTDVLLSSIKTLHSQSEHKSKNCCREILVIRIFVTLKGCIFRSFAVRWASTTVLQMTPSVSRAQETAEILFSTKSMHLFFFSADFYVEDFI